MNYYHILIIYLNILASQAGNLEVGDCVISDAENDIKIRHENIITIAKIKDTENVKKKFTVTGDKLTVETPNSEDSGATYIEIQSKSDSFTVSLIDKFSDIFENDVQFHSDKENTYTLNRTLSLACGDNPAEQYIFQIEVEDTNNHSPVFEEKSYTLQLSKMITPEVDITTVHNKPLITVEDIDFSNTAIDVSIDDEERFSVDYKPEEGNRRFNIILKAVNTINITEPIKITITVTDTGKPSLSNSTYLTISAPTLLGECTIEDGGRLEYGFFESTIEDTDTTFNLTLDVTGALDIQLPNDDDTGAPFINMALTDDKSQIKFNLSAIFADEFEKNVSSQDRQSKITLYRSAMLTCGEAKQGFTFGLGVKDTNNHAPEFINTDLSYDLPKQLMPKVDLTSAGEELLVQDLDFSNTGITFTADPPFIMESVYKDTIENKRRYRGILRVPSYYTIENDSMEVNIIAIDNGTPPQSTAGKITLKVKNN